MASRREQYLLDPPVVEEAIAHAIEEGWMRDIRGEIQTANERYNRTDIVWPRRLLSEILGQCTHHNGSKNRNNPKATADYHTSKNNHIIERPMPSIVYPICIPDSGEVLITGEILDRTYAQAYGGLANGDENLHLVPILVMGGFKAPGFRGYAAAPTPVQLTGYVKACRWLAELAHFGPEGNFYHAHFGKPACPGYSLMHVVDGWREMAKQDLKTDLDWQQALLRWNSSCLPRYGADGDWGKESKRALVQFQKAKGLHVTAMQNPFSELILLRDYPMAESNTSVEVTLPHT